MGIAKSIYSMLSDPEALLSLEPEELAGVLLEYLNSLEERSGQLHRYNFSLSCADQYPKEYQEQIARALTEAWVWLEREGLIAPRPATQGEWVFVTRRGRKVKDRAGLDSYRRADLLPRRLLHPIIAQKVWSAFIRGEYDTAVFQAFKEVEVAVREAGGYALTDIGIALMRKAFDSLNGPLTDQNLPQAERESLAHLFAGAIGSYKNPQSHRNVSVTDPAEAVEMVILASHLLKIVDARSPKP